MNDVAYPTIERQLSISKFNAFTCNNAKPTNNAPDVKININIETVNQKLFIDFSF